MFESLSLFTIFFALLFGAATAALAVGILWVRWLVFPTPASDRRYDLAVHAHLAVALLLSMLMALVFAEAESDYTRARENVWREADLLHDVFRNLSFYGGEAAEAVSVQMADYTEALIEDEWRQLSRNEYSDEASRIFQEAYLAALELEVSTTAQAWLHDHILDNMTVLSGLRHERFFVARDRLSAIFWLVIVVGFLLVCGYFTVYVNSGVNRTILATVGFFFGMTSYLIFAFEDPFDGHLSVSPKPLVFLHAEVMAPTIAARAVESDD